jgi:hypothetical protein
MPATQRMAIIAYSPALASDDSRPLAVVHAMERAFPNLHLEWTVSQEGLFIPLPHREAWLAQGRPDVKGFRLICNGDEKFLVTLSGWERPGSSSPGGQPQFEVHAKIPLAADAIAAAAEVLEAVAEAARASWGHATPFSAGVDIARQTRARADAPEPPPRGLPVLSPPWDIPSPEFPERLGWLNYWSAATAKAMGFPDPARDADLLSCSRRTATGGWIVRLTDTPLDLDIPSHLEALMNAYERFPAIGGRLTPR